MLIQYVIYRRTVKMSNLLTIAEGLSVIHCITIGSELYKANGFSLYKKGCEKIFYPETKNLPTTYLISLSKLKTSQGLFICHYKPEVI